MQANLQALLSIQSPPIPKGFHSRTSLFPCCSLLFVTFCHVLQVVGAPCRVLLLLVCCCWGETSHSTFFEYTLRCVHQGSPQGKKKCSKT